MHVESATLREGWLSARYDGVARRHRLFADGARLTVHDGELRQNFEHAPAFAFTTSGSIDSDRVLAPMPGRIVVVKAAVGDEVAEGDELLVMEAMKMELTLRSPRAGRVEAIQAAAGEFVEADAVLVRLEANHEDSLMLLGCALMTLGACSETRFESPPGDKVESCDARWKGLWVDASADAAAEDPDELAFLVDPECRFHMIERPEKDGPPKLIHVPLNFVHDSGQDYLVVADNQLAGVVDLDPIHGIDPAPEKSYFPHVSPGRRQVSIAGVDSRRVGHLVLDNALDGTIDRRKNELHVFVRGDSATILQILRKHDLFEAKPGAEVRRTPLSLEEYEVRRSASRKIGKP